MNAYRGRRELVREFTPLNLSGQRMWPHTLHDACIARNSAARGYRAPRVPIYRGVHPCTPEECLRDLTALPPTSV